VILIANKRESKKKKAQSSITSATHGHLVLRFSLTIIVLFPDKKSDKVLMQVDVTSEGGKGACNETTWWQNQTDKDWILCSEKDKPKACEKQCGVGTGRGIPIIEGL
jgi:hypothetical protein